MPSAAAAFLLRFFFSSPRLRRSSRVDSILIPTSDWLNLTFINIDILPQSFLPRALVPSALSFYLFTSLFLSLFFSLAYLFLLLSVVPRDSSFIQSRDSSENFIVFDLIKITLASKIRFCNLLSRAGI